MSDSKSQARASDASAATPMVRHIVARCGLGLLLLAFAAEAHAGWFSSDAPKPEEKRIVFSPARGQSFQKLVGARALRTEEVGVLSRIVEEKKSERKSLEARIRNEYGIQPDRSYTYNPTNRTIYLVQPVEDGEKKSVRLLAHRIFPTEEECAAFLRVFVAKDAVAGQTELLEGLLQEKKAELERIQNSLVHDFGIDLSKQYRFDADENALYVMLPPPPSREELLAKEKAAREAARLEEAKRKAKEKAERDEAERKRLQAKADEERAARLKKAAEQGAKEKAAQEKAEEDRKARAAAKAAKEKAEEEKAVAEVLRRAEAAKQEKMRLEQMSLADRVKASERAVRAARDVLEDATDDLRDAEDVLREAREKEAAFQETTRRNESAVRDRVAAESSVADAKKALDAKKAAYRKIKSMDGIPDVTLSTARIAVDRAEKSLADAEKALRAVPSVRKAVPPKMSVADAVKPVEAARAAVEKARAALASAEAECARLKTQQGAALKTAPRKP